MAAIFLIILGVYLLLGVCFALWFITKGVERIDKVAADSDWKPKILWFPASAALWPILMKKCLLTT